VPERAEIRRYTEGNRSRCPGRPPQHPQTILQQRLQHPQLDLKTSVRCWKGLLSSRGGKRTHVRQRLMPTRKRALLVQQQTQLRHQRNRQSQVAGLLMRLGPQLVPQPVEASRSRKRPRHRRRLPRMRGGPRLLKQNQRRNPRVMSRRVCAQALHPVIPGQEGVLSRQSFSA